MLIGLVGKKAGMTRVFIEDGSSVPVTVIQVLPNRITQLKTLENDGYTAVQVTTGSAKPSRVTKALKGHYAKAGVEAGDGLWEFAYSDGDLSADVKSQLTQGGSFTVELLANTKYVDVTAVSRGKGFAGVIKRHNFTMGDATHGNSLSHRAPGSIGQRQTPGRVFKNKRMAGRMGGKQCTVQNQLLVRVDPARNLLLVKGVVPGAPGANVIIKPAVKKANNTERMS